MAKTKILNIDNLPEIDAELKVTLDGVDYNIPTLNRDLAERVNAIEQDAGEGANLHDVLSRQFEALTGSAVGTFANTDMRKLKAAVTMVLREVEKAGEHSNRSSRRGR